MDTWISFIRITLALATGLFGALGLLTKYKDETGKITKWGRIALGGILLSSSFSVILYALEASKSKAAADKAKAEANATAQLLQNILTNAQTTADQQKRTLDETNVLKLGLEETLKEQRYISKGMESSLATQQSVLTGNERILGGVSKTIAGTTTTLRATQRLLQPLGEIEVGFQIGIVPSPDISDYLQRLRHEIKLAEEAFLKTREIVPRPGLIVNSSGDSIGSIIVTSDSPLFPPGDSSTDFLKYIPFKISFYRAAVTPRLWRDYGIDFPLDPKTSESSELAQYFGPPLGPPPDLQLYLQASDSSDDPNVSRSSRFGLASLKLSYHKDIDSFSLWVPDLQATVAFDNGSIASVLDLPGLTMVVEFLNRHAELELWSLKIEVAKGRRIVIRRSMLKKEVIGRFEYYFHTIRPQDVVTGP